MRKDIFYYFRKSVAFFDIKAKALPPVVFLIILALYALYFYLMQTDIQAYNLLYSQYLTAEDAAAPVQAPLAPMFIGLFIMLIINLVSFVYLDAVVREARNLDYTTRDCVNSALRRFPGLTGVTIIKNILVGAGLFFFIIPGIILAIMFLFSECAILDKGKKVIESLKFSRMLTYKKRGDIFKIELFCNLIIAIFVILLLSVFSSNNLIVFQYIMLFTLSICTLIEHRLVALLYVDASAAYEGAAQSGGGDAVDGSGDTANGGRDAADGSDRNDGSDGSDGSGEDENKK